MHPLTSLCEIEALYATRGGLHYGEGITQIEHALQCAALAEQDGAAPGLVVAALLHDVGHLLEDEEGVVGAAADRRHEAVGAAALRGLFGPPVRAPIMLHVSAKRYLCAVDPQYRDRLSAASQASLIVQGGPLDAAGIARFERRPYWREAVALRRFDDTGKATTPSGRRFADHLPLMRALWRGHSADAGLSGG